MIEAALWGIGGALAGVGIPFTVYTLATWIFTGRWL